MGQYPNQRTLQLKTPVGYSFALTLLLLALVLFVGENLARITVVRGILAAPSMGSAHKGLERQLNRLDIYAADRESIDCIFLGDSTVMTDFAPKIFEQAFRDQTGMEIDCFNFGLGASTASSSAALAQILVEDYEPRLLIYGTHAREFAVPAENGDAAVLLDTPWVQYRLGTFPLEGWLFERSYLYRYLGLFKHLVRLETEHPILRTESEIQSGFKNGYYPIENPNPVIVAQIPDKASDHPGDQNYFGSLGNFQILPSNLQALDEILALQSTSTQVMIVEMPVFETFLHYFGNKEKDYQTFIDTVGQRISARDVPLWKTSYLKLFPSDVWGNRNHLNLQGSQIFSQWFGRKLGEALQAKTIMLPSG